MSHDLPYRATIRLPDFDYSSPNWYYVTIYTQGRICRLGKVVDDRSFLSPFGRIVNQYIYTIPIHYPNIMVDEYHIMPNHIHMIIGIGRTQGSAPTLGSIIKQFKTMTTHQYIEGIILHDWMSFDGKLWQRNYYEHIVRDEDDLNRIRYYIRNNPANWTKDKLFS